MSPRPRGQQTLTRESLPGQRRTSTPAAPLRAQEAQQAPATGWDQLPWRTVLRVSLSRGVLAVVIGLLVWSVLPLALGWAPRVILSGSMEPRIHTGDVVVTRAIDPTLLGEGHVVTTRDPDQAGKTRTHRYVETDAAGRIVTRGDANEQDDSSPVDADDVLGVGVIRVPYVGLPAYWITARNVLALGIAFVVLCGLVLAAWTPGGRPPGGGERPGGSRGAGRDRTARGHGRRRAGTVATTLAVSAAILSTTPGAAQAAFTGKAVARPSSFAAATTFYPYRVEVLGDSPELYWKLDETSGSSIQDAGSANRDGTLAGQSFAFNQAGALGELPNRAIRFTTAGIASNQAVIPGSAFSVEGWVRTQSTSGGRILGIGNASGIGHSTAVDRQLYLGTNGRVYFGIGAAKATLNSSAAVNDGAWHHVVGTYTPGSNGMKLYVDGALQGQRSATTSMNDGYWRAGFERMSGWPSNPSGDYLNGTLDELAVYGDVLTPAEVAAHYAVAAR